MENIKELTELQNGAMNSKSSPTAKYAWELNAFWFYGQQESKDLCVKCSFFYEG